MDIDWYTLVPGSIESDICAISMLIKHASESILYTVFILEMQEWKIHSYNVLICYRQQPKSTAPRPFRDMTLPMYIFHVMNDADELKFPRGWTIIPYR